MIAAATLALPTYTFTIPETARSLETDPHTVTIRAFTVGQELDALKASSVGGRFEYELLQRIVTEVDGRPHDQGIDFIDRCSSAVRVLLVSALNKISMPSNKDSADFLGSMKVQV